MARIGKTQALGSRKHRRCEAITGRRYATCRVNGSLPHFWAKCFRVERGAKETVGRYDLVNYRLGVCMPGTGGEPLTEGAIRNRKIRGAVRRVTREGVLGAESRGAVLWERFAKATGAPINTRKRQVPIQIEESKPS